MSLEALPLNDLLTARREIDRLRAQLARLVEAARAVAADPYPGAVKFDGALELKRLDDLVRLRAVLHEIEEGNK